MPCLADTIIRHMRCVRKMRAAMKPDHAPTIWRRSGSLRNPTGRSSLPRVITRSPINMALRFVNGVSHCERPRIDHLDNLSGIAGDNRIVGRGGNVDHVGNEANNNLGTILLESVDDLASLCP